MQDHAISSLLRSPLQENAHEGSGDSLTAPLGLGIDIHHQRYRRRHHSSAIVGEAWQLRLDVDTRAGNYGATGLGGPLPRASAGRTTWAVCN